MQNWFSNRLSLWYKKNKRDLPWRRTTDPFRIWLSEIILQQTQVSQGLAYYTKFTERFPNVAELANATEDEVLKLWQGLGYYSRARNLHGAAMTMRDELKGKFPSSYNEIIKLKGVGEYTAAAISSFAFNEPHAVVDGNVYRLLSRLFNISTPIDTGTGKKQFAELADQLLSKEQPALHNQAIMEFGSQYCRPVNPDCENCIFSDKCLAFSRKTVNSLPVKSKKTKIRKRYLNFIVVGDAKENVLINKRGANDIWKGLYEFPVIESDRALEPGVLFNDRTFKKLSGKNFELKHTTPEYRHILTHQHLYAKFYVLRNDKKARENDYALTSLEELDRYAFPRLIEKFLEDCDLKEILYI